MSVYSSAYAYINVRDPENEGSICGQILGGGYGTRIQKVTRQWMNIFGAHCEAREFPSAESLREILGSEKGGDDTARSDCY